MNDALMRLFDGHLIAGLLAVASVHWHLRQQTRVLESRVSAIEARLESHLREAHS